jgi:hypothetical protein
MSDEMTGARLTAMWNEGDTVDAFTVDHAKQLSDMILVINRTWLERFQKVLEDTEYHQLENVRKGWANDIAIACKAKMCGMNAMMEQYRKLATEAVNRYPGSTIELYPQPKPGETITLKRMEPVAPLISDHDFSQDLGACSICGRGIEEHLSMRTTNET